MSISPDHSPSSQEKLALQSDFTSKSLLTSKFKDGILHIQLDDDATRNSLSLNMIHAINSAISTINETTRCVVISSTGPIFCSGHNANELIDITEEQANDVFHSSTNLMINIRKCPAPVVAQVQGGAIGAGCMLALSCDFVIASEEAYFQTPGGSKGWFCFTPMATLVHHCSSRRALEMLFTGDRISANQAFTWGMINKVSAIEELQANVENFISKITRGNTEMLRIAKDTFYDVLDKGYLPAMHDMANMMAKTCLLPSAQERLSSITKPKK